MTINVVFAEACFSLQQFNVVLKDLNINMSLQIMYFPEYEFMEIIVIGEYTLHTFWTA